MLTEARDTELAQKNGSAIDARLIECWQRIVEDPVTYQVAELHFLWYELAQEEVKQAYLTEFKANPVYKKYVEDAYYAPAYEFESLGRLPVGTLGHTYYQFIKSNHLSEDLGLGYRQYQEAMQASGQLEAVPTEIKYATIRSYQMHDLFHQLTGFDTTQFGEVGLQAFTLAQFRRPYPAFVLSVAMSRAAFLVPDQIEGFMDAITRGWQLGKQAKNLVTVHWEEMFDRPLDEIKREYNLL